MDMNEPELEGLKPCPFCGAKAEVVFDYEVGFESYSVWCENCRSSSAIYDDKTDAVEAWNRRTNDYR